MFCANWCRYVSDHLNNTLTKALTIKQLFHRPIVVNVYFTNTDEKHIITWYLQNVFGVA